MKNPSRAAKYGPEYEQLLLTAWEQAPFRFPLEDRKSLLGMKAKIYSYFRQLRDENLRLDLVEMADSLTLITEGNTIVFQRSSDTEDHLKIRAFLGLDKDKFGLHSPGTELKSPDLLNNRLAQQVSRIRERTAGGKKVVPPMKTGK